MLEKIYIYKTFINILQHEHLPDIGYHDMLRYHLFEFSYWLRSGVLKTANELLPFAG